MIQSALFSKSLNKDINTVVLQRKRRLPADRSHWNQTAWDNYLAEAMRMEGPLGQRLRALYREIETLERQAALPIAA